MKMITIVASLLLLSQMSFATESNVKNIYINRTGTTVGFFKKSRFCSILISNRDSKDGNLSVTFYADIAAYSATGNEFSAKWDGEKLIVIPYFHQWTELETDSIIQDDSRIEINFSNDGIPKNAVYHTSSKSLNPKLKFEKNEKVACDFE